MTTPAVRRHHNKTVRTGPSQSMTNLCEPRFSCGKSTKCDLLRTRTSGGLSHHNAHTYAGSAPWIPRPCPSPFLCDAQTHTRTHKNKRTNASTHWHNVALKYRRLHTYADMTIDMRTLKNVRMRARIQTKDIRYYEHTRIYGVTRTHLARMHSYKHSYKQRIVRPRFLLAHTRNWQKQNKVWRTNSVMEPFFTLPPPSNIKDENTNDPQTRRLGHVLWVCFYFTAQGCAWIRKL